MCMPKQKVMAQILRFIIANLRFAWAVGVLPIIINKFMLREICRNLHAKSIASDCYNN